MCLLLAMFGGTGNAVISIHTGGNFSPARQVLLRQKWSGWTEITWTKIPVRGHSASLFSGQVPWSLYSLDGLLIDKPVIMYIERSHNGSTVSVLKLGECRHNGANSNVSDIAYMSTAPESHTLFVLQRIRSGQSINTPGVSTNARPYARGEYILPWAS